MVLLSTLRDDDHVLLRLGLLLLLLGLSLSFRLGLRLSFGLGLSLRLCLLLGPLLGAYARDDGAVLLGLDAHLFAVRSCRDVAVRCGRVRRRTGRRDGVESALVGSAGNRR